MAAETPQGTPTTGGAELDLDPEKLAQVLEDPARRSAVTISLSVHGGLPEERYDLDIKATGKGELWCSLNDAMHKRRLDRAQLRMDEARFGAILKTLEPVALARTAQRTGGFPPCSLIGRLEVTIGDRTITTYFMADPEQARTAGYEPPAGVLRAVEMLYDEAEQSLGIGRLRP